MAETKILKEPVEVADRLQELFGVDRDELMKVVHAAVAGRAIAVGNDPITAGGYFAYSYGTRAMREVFRAIEGYELDRVANIESVVNKARGVKIIFQSTDVAADSRSPKAVSGKGVACERVVELGQGNLFEDLAEDERARANAAVWFICVAQQGDVVLAEISCPKAVEGGQFSGFHERIFLVQYGEWKTPDVSVFDNIGPPPGPEFEVNVSKKRNK